MSKSISIFLPSLSGGGAEKMMLRISSELARRGHNVDLVVASRSGEYIEMVDNNVQLVNLNAPSVPGYSLLGCIPSLTKYLRMNAPDAFLSVLNRANVVAIISHQLSQVDSRLIVSERNNISEYIKHTNFKNKIIPYLIKNTYTKADNIIAISHGLSDDLSTTTGINKKEITVIYNPAYSEDIEVKSKQKVTHPWLKEEHNVLLGVGSLTVQKDFTTLINAFAKIHKKTNSKLIILGKGNQRKKLTKHIRNKGLTNHIDMPGFVDNPYAYMRRSDLFVLSSRWEGFGNVIVEAMACGTPVVATDCPSGPGEILKQGTYGRLAKVGDPHSLATEIVAELENPTSKNKLQERARNFSIKQIGTQYENVLLGVE